MADKETRDIATKEKQQLAKPQEQTLPGRYYAPDVNIYEFEDSLKLWADMPGVKEKDFNVTLKDGVLTIIGQVATDVGVRPMYTEYNVGNYYREFALNEDIDESKSLKIRICKRSFNLIRFRAVCRFATFPASIMAMCHFRRTHSAFARAEGLLVSSRL